MSPITRVALATLTTCLVAATSAQANTLTPVSNDAAGAQRLAAAMSDPDTQLGNASFQTVPPASKGRPNATGASKLGAFFPSGGRTSFAVLTTGKPVTVQPRGTAGWVSPDRGTEIGSSAPSRTTTAGLDLAKDVTVLQVPVTVPATANCLTFDFQMLSAEYPEWVDTWYNDAFVAELDKTTWSLSKGSGVVNVTAPDNFAFDRNGKPLTVNSTTWSKANAAGTGYADYGATPLLSASKRVTPGAHTLFLSLFDTADHKLDTAILMDALRVGFVPNPSVNCKPGAQPVLYSLELDGGEGTDYVGTQRTFDATVKTSAGQPVTNAPVEFTVTGANPRTVTVRTNGQGVATLTHTGTNAGLDTVAACYDADADDACEATDSTTYTFDARPKLSIRTPAAVTEGDTGSRLVELPVTLDKPARADVTVNYATASGTATAGADYTATSGTLRIAKGATSGKVAVAVLGDRLVEGDEAFRVDLSSPSVATLGGGSATVTVADDDTTALSVGPAAGGGSVDVAESGGTVQLTVRSALVSSKPITVDWTTANGSATAGADYSARSGKATIPAGQTATTITVPVLDDALVEDDETFALVLSNPSPGASLSDAGKRATVTIRDDDTATLSVAPSAGGNAVTVAEPSGGVPLTITTSKASSKPITVRYATADNTATAGADYTATSGTATIPAGETSVTITVPVLDDDLVEGDETFVLELSDPSAGSVLGEGGRRVTITIADDDTAVLSAESRSVAEDAGAATVRVTSTKRSSKPITVRYATVDGTATAGQDYTATAGTLSIPAGETTGSFQVPVLPDAVVEPDEAFAVTLSEPSARASVGQGATVTITNDDRAAEPPAQEPQQQPQPQQQAAAPAEGGVAGQAAQGNAVARVLCGSDIVLLDVLRTGRRVQVAGLAASRYVGRPVTILAGGRAVGTARVNADSSFAATVGLPEKAARSTIRYSAVVGERVSRALKLQRRLLITKRSGLDVSGRVDAAGRPMPKTVTFYRQLTCTQAKVFKTVKVSRSGRFSVRLAKPAAGEVYALFRVAAKLGRESTFTLPIAVR